MKIKRLLSAAAIAILISGNTVSQTINPMTTAVLDGYSKILKENPQDYFTLYQRAAQYFRLSDYDKALSDITKAIEFTPDKESDMLCRELALASDIYIQTENYPAALQMADKAIAIMPNNYPLLYKHGNICLYLKDYDRARDSFEALRRNQPRSQEAYFGLAQVAAAEGNKTELEDMLKAAENCNPSSYITYCRLGDIYTTAKDYPNAATSYLSAFGLADDTSRPIQSLVNLAKTNYKSVADALDYAATKSSNLVPIYLLKGNIAYSNGHFDDALSAFTSLSTLPEGKDASVYDNLARCALALNNLQSASDYADTALGMTPSTRTYITKSEIELARGNADAALIAADKAKTIDQNSPEAMMAAASAQILKQDWEGALTNLNRAAMLDPSNLKALLMRAYLYSNGIKNTRAASFDMQRVASSNDITFPSAMYKALAQTISGKRLDGDSTIEKALKNDSSADALIYAAIYYANTDSADKARGMRDKGIASGFANKYILDSQIVPGMDLSPIRK